MPANNSFMLVSMRKRCHSWSSSHVPPSGRDSTYSSPGTPATVCAPPSLPSSLLNAPISRSMPARSSWSARPNEYSIFVRAVWATGSHSLCASCR